MDKIVKNKVGSQNRSIVIHWLLKWQLSKIKI